MKRIQVRRMAGVPAHCPAGRRQRHYSPERAAFQDFDPFWEFVAGPIKTGSYANGAVLWSKELHPER